MFPGGQPLCDYIKRNIVQDLADSTEQTFAICRIVLLQWRYTSGISVHNKVRMARDDTKGQGGTCPVYYSQIIEFARLRSFSLKKLHCQQKTRQVIYRSKMSNNKNKRNFEVFPVLDFIAAISIGEVLWLVFPTACAVTKSPGWMCIHCSPGCWTIFYETEVLVFLAE